MQAEYEAIGETAGLVYRALEHRGSKTTRELRNMIGIPNPRLFYEALGWLAREGKIEFTHNGSRKWTIGLSEDELKK